MIIDFINWIPHKRSIVKGWLQKKGPSPHASMRSTINLRIINESTPNCCRLICRKVCWVCSGFLLSDSPNPSQLHDNRPLKSSNRLRHDPQTGRITTRFEYSSQRPQSLGYPCGRIIDDLTVCVQTLFFFNSYIPCF